MTRLPDAPGFIALYPAPLPGAFTRVYSSVLPLPRPVQYNCLCRPKRGERESVFPQMGDGKRYQNSAARY